MKKITFSAKKDCLANEESNTQLGFAEQKNKDHSTVKNQRDDRPPDLDEILAKLKENFFKKKDTVGSAGDGGDDDNHNQGNRGPSFNAASMGISPKLIVLVLVVLVSIWLVSGFYIVNPAERGVVLRFGNYVKTAMPGPNWHLPYPISEAYIIDVDQIRNVEIGYRSSRNTSTASSVTSESLMLTIDENIVDVKFAVQYRVNNAEDYLFNVRDPDLTLTQAVESAIRETVGKSTLNFVLTNGRDQVAQNTRDLSQGILDRYQTGLSITSINMQDVQPPEQVQDAFNDAVRAREDQQKLINEAEAYSNDIIPRARGLAARMEEEANAYASQVTAIANGEAERFISIYNAYTESPEVTEIRLSLETMQQVLQNTSKVIVDSDNSSIVNLLGTPSFGSMFGGSNSSALNGSATGLNSPNYSNNPSNTNNSQSSQSNNATGTSGNALSRLERAMQRITGSQ